MGQTGIDELSLLPSLEYQFWNWVCDSNPRRNLNLKRKLNRMNFLQFLTAMLQSEHTSQAIVQLINCRQSANSKQSAAINTNFRLMNNGPARHRHCRRRLHPHRCAANTIKMQKKQCYCLDRPTNYESIWRKNDYSLTKRRFLWMKFMNEIARRRRNRNPLHRRPVSPNRLVQP